MLKPPISVLKVVLQKYIREPPCTNYGLTGSSSLQPLTTEDQKKIRSMFSF